MGEIDCIRLDIRQGWDPERQCGTYDSGLTIRDSKIGGGRGTPVRDILKGGEVMRPSVTTESKRRRSEYFKLFSQIKGNSTNYCVFI